MCRDNFPLTSLYARGLERTSLNVLQSWYATIVSNYIVYQAMCHALMNNRARKKGEKDRAINIREKANRNNDAPGTIFASRIVETSSTVPQRKSGRDEARRISCSTR